MPAEELKNKLRDELYLLKPQSDVGEIKQIIEKYLRIFLNRLMK